MSLQLTSDRASFVLREEWKRLRAGAVDCEARIADLEERLESHRLALADVEEGLEKIMPGWVERMQEAHPEAAA